MATKKKPKMKSKAGAKTVRAEKERKAREDKREQEQLRREQDDIPRVRFDEEA